jgi:hypothetical protein
MEGCSMITRISLLAGLVAFANMNNALMPQETRSANSPTTQMTPHRQGQNRKPEDQTVMPTHDELLKWMNAYFVEYNASAQNAKTIHRMDRYFAPNFTFIPYMYIFGGPKNAITGRENFYSMLTNHPADYEKLTVHDIVVDEKRMVTVAFLGATIFETATNKVKIKKDYLSLYELILDETGSPKIKTIRFFWEALPPEAEAAGYAVDKSKWGKQR